VAVYNDRDGLAFNVMNHSVAFTATLLQ